MRSSLPVPSQGALRALRQIALGTSCTIAIGTALIAEDRRRRIHTAREVRENARRIKGSRQYYGAGAAGLASHEEHINPNLELGTSRWADLPSLQESQTAESSRSPASSSADHGVESLGRTDWIDPPPDHQHDPAAPETLRSQERREASDNEDNNHITETYVAPPTAHFQNSHGGPFRVHQQESGPSVIRPLRSKRSALVSSSHGEYEQLSTTLEERLYTVDVRDNHRTLGLKLADLIPRPTKTGGVIDQSTLDSCIQLSRACLDSDTIDAFLPTIQAIAEIGGIESKAFYDLRPEAYISRLLDRRHTGSEPATENALESVKQATTIFLTSLTSRPGFATAELLDAGIRLFEATLEAKLHKRSVSIYLRLSEYENFTPSADHVTRLIFAIRDQSRLKDFLNIFTNIFPKTQPKYSEFTAVVHAVLKSACESGQLAYAEDALRVATDMAKSRDFLIPPHWFTKVLDWHWKMSHNLDSTRALFLRLQPLANTKPLNKALYSSMVRFCVLDRKTSEAARYIRILTDEGRQTLDLRTSGYLIMAKAIEGNWEGVTDSFRDLKESTKGQPSEYSDIFTPVFKLYASSHALPQTENFFRSFVEDFKIRPNKYMFNIMVDAYAKTEEIEMMADWIAAMRPYGLEIDSVTFNSIISKSFDRWPKRIHQMTRLCEKVQKIDSSLVDLGTVNILRAASLLSADGNALMAKRWLERADGLKSGAGRNPHRDVLELMNTSIKQGDRSQAVYHYRRALQDGVMMPPDVVALAVVQCSPYHLNDRNIGPAMDLIAESQARGLNTCSAMGPLLVAQARLVGETAGDMGAFLKDITMALEKRGLQVPKSVVTTVTASFVDRAQYRRALNFWFYMHKHNGLSDDAIDLVDLTVLLNAFLSLSDLTGISWAIGMICRNGLTPDIRLKLLLKNSRRGVRKYLLKKPDHKNANDLLTVVEKSLETVMALRARLATRHLGEEKILRVIKEASLAKVLTAPEQQHPSKSRGPAPNPKIRRVMPSYASRTSTIESPNPKIRRITPTYATPSSLPESKSHVLEMALAAR